MGDGCGAGRVEDEVIRIGGGSGGQLLMPNMKGYRDFISNVN